MSQSSGLADYMRECAFKSCRQARGLIEIGGGASPVSTHAQVSLAASELYGIEQECGRLGSVHQRAFGTVVHTVRCHLD